MADRIPILLDTDPGSDIDDVVSLAYLLREPRCELIGVTTVSGKTEQRAGIVDFVLRSAGRTDVPVFAGLHGPMLIGAGQPEVPHYAAIADKPHRKDFPRGEAIEFLRKTIRSRPGEITLLTIGPLTNIATLFALDPEIPSLLKGLVTMGGRFFPPADMEKWSEWNILCDPTAAQIFYSRRVPGHVSYGLDVTMKCQMSTDEVGKHFGSRAILKDLLAMADVWFRHTPVITFHDPLAAASIFRPELCTYERGVVHLEPSADVQHASRTYFALSEAGDGPHKVARTVDVKAFFDAYFGVF